MRLNIQSPRQAVGAFLQIGGIILGAIGIFAKISALTVLAAVLVGSGIFVIYPTTKKNQ